MLARLLALAYLVMALEDGDNEKHSPPSTAWWNPGSADKALSAPMPFGNGPAPPPVPKGHSGGDNKDTSVDTPSLDAFAKNLDPLVQIVGNAQTSLARVDVQPGAFYHADLMRNSINGVNGDSGVKAQYNKVLVDLKNGLASLKNAVTTMSKNYKDTEDLNKASAKDLESNFNEATTYFGSSINDSKGGGTPGK